MVVYPIDGGKPILLDEGSPIFFEWAPNGFGIVAHLLHPIRRTSKVKYYSIVDSELDYVVSKKSGGFCSPVFLNDQLIFAEQIGDITQLVLHNLNSNESTNLCSFDGVLAIQPRPGKLQIAIAVTTRGDGSPYTGIQLLDLNDGELTCMYEGAAQSLFWNSTGEKLLMSHLDNVGRCMRWNYLEDGQIKQLGKFWPTREQLFYLHFFEQFSLSHNTLSNDGNTFYFSGYEPPRERSTKIPKPIIFKGTLEDQSPFEPIVIGKFPSLSNWGS